MEAVEYLLGDLAALRRRGVVDGAKLLITLPGDVHFILWVAGVETVVDLGLLLLSEVFDAVPEQPSDLVDRARSLSASKTDWGPRSECGEQVDLPSVVAAHGEDMTEAVPA